MSPRHFSHASRVVDDEPTPKPISAVSASTAAVLGYFESPPSRMRALDAAWQEALALYGDEDSDAWVTALEDGTHPLCRVRTA